MSKIIVTAAQVPVSDYISKNVKTVKRAIQQAAGHDWVVLPEGMLSGYCQPPNLMNRDPAKVAELEAALEEVETYAEHMKTGMMLGTGFLEVDQQPYNQVRAYRRDGQLINTYHKQQLTRSHEGGGETFYYLPGYENRRFYVDNDFKVVGASLICNDVWATPRVSPQGNPFHIGELARHGAEIVFVSANCNVKTWDPLVYEWHDVNLRMQAKEFGVFIVVSNSSIAMGWGPHDRYDPDTEFESKRIERVQCRSGIISPEGEWIGWCEDTGEDYCTMELEF